MTTCTNTDDFVQEIDVKRANFQAYAILSRTESPTQYTYTFYVIPSYLIKAGGKDWSTKYKNNTSKVICWETGDIEGFKMSVTPAMSNQLWIKLDKSFFKDYAVIDAIIVQKKKIIDYATLFDKLSLEGEHS